MSLRFVRVEQALGLSTGVFDATDVEVWQALSSAVAAAVPEANDLEFKRDWWHRTEEVAKDCAALANAGGGIMIVGIDDDNRDIAAGLAAFAMPQGFDVWVQQATASHTAPKVPVVRTRWIPDPDDATQGVAVIAVPRSPLIPHAVAYTRERMGYPIRRSSTTDWLSESEVADRYRNRFDMARSDQDRALEIDSAARPALDRASTVWVTVVLVPSLRGHLGLSEEQVRNTEDLANAWQYDMTLDAQTSSPLGARLRRRRIVLSGDSRNTRSHYQHHELWLDGGGFASAAIGHTRGDAARPWTYVSQAELEFYALRLTELLTRHAVSVGAGGDVVLTAQVLPAWDNDSVDEAVAVPDVARVGLPDRVGTPLLFLDRNPSDDVYALARRVDAEPGQTTAPLLDIADTPRELALTVRRLLLDTLPEDGITPGRLLTSEGALRLDSLPGDRARLRGLTAGRRSEGSSASPEAEPEHLSTAK